MKFISYSQNFEDVLLNRLFRNRLQGFYIDIGALHPTFDSVTKAFYNRGWSGINIEPIKEYYTAFEVERPRDINLNIGISNLEGNLDFFEVVGQPGNSTLSKEIAYKIAQDKGFNVSQYTISVRTLASICQEYVNQKIDFLKIDVEGLEEQVILGGDWDKFRPIVLIIETTIPNTNIRCDNNISDILKNKGYHNVFFDGINDYYIAEESKYLSKYFSYPVNVLDSYIDYRVIEKQQQINELTQLLNSSESNIKTIANYSHLELEQLNLVKPIIIIDGVFFQLEKTGIARVWRSLLEQWANTDFANHILVLDRANTTPKINGIRYLNIPRYDYNNTEADKQMLQQICDKKAAEIFISTYYTTPIETPSVFMAYDMIPEVLGYDLNQPMWREKHHAIQYASSYIAISKNTASDLVKYFNKINKSSVKIAYCGVSDIFVTATPQQIKFLRNKYRINKPYFLLVGVSSNYKNSILFLQAFSQLTNSNKFDIICTGKSGVFTSELRQYTSESQVHLLQLSDEELAIAYSGAVALVYPSKYEGFGMPIAEAMACGCPVITCPNSSIPEVAGDAAIYVNNDDIDGMVNALCKVQEFSVRSSLITAGFKKVQQFDWQNMAETVKSALINTTLLKLNIQEINYITFPDWSQPESILGLELEKVIKSIETHLDSAKTTLLIDTTNIDPKDAEIFLSSVVMNLLLNESVDVTTGLEIIIIGELSHIQWKALLTYISSIIHLKNENKQAVENYQRILGNNNQSDLITTTEITTTAANSNNISALVKIIYDTVNQYDLAQSDSAIIDGLRHLRKQIANYWLHTNANELEKLYTSNIGNAHQAIVKSGIQYESLVDFEKEFLTEIVNTQNFNTKEENRHIHILVAMLYYPPHELPLSEDFEGIPYWLLTVYLQYSLQVPRCFSTIGESDKYYQYSNNLMTNLHKDIINHSDSDIWRNIAGHFTSANFIPLYFNDKNLKNIYAKRADILQVFLQKFEQPFEYDFSETSPEKNKIRVGILALHFGVQTETFATLSVYKHLNRDVFEIVLFTFQISNHRLERYCFGHADKVVSLPTELYQQVQIIRAEDLDILFIGTNITATTHPITLLALYRLARIQIVDANSPVSTGMRHIDYYISSQLSESADNAQQHYTETLIQLESPPQCFDFATEAQILPTTAISRASLGINENTTVYISGANYYKIIPELEETWAKIIANVPNSVLLLYPFNPNWSSSYPSIAFWRRIVSTFTKYGLHKNRLIILESAPNRADVKERLKLADIYLDSYPYSGMTSLIDPLEVALPTIVREGKSSRSKKGASLLRELQRSDLVTSSEESYIQLAVALGNNSELREEKSNQIKEAMNNNPSFLDSRSYSAKMETLFKDLFSNYLSKNITANLQLRDINLIIFPDWTQPEDELGFELQQVIQTLATHPNNEKITLIIYTGNIATEDAEMFLSSVAMNLLMEDLDISDTIGVSLIDNLGDMQWQSLLPQIFGIIILEHEDKETVAQISMNNLSSYQLDNFINQI